jgi:hypothetical protein
MKSPGIEVEALRREASVWLPELWHYVLSLSQAKHPEKVFTASSFCPLIIFHSYLLVLNLVFPLLLLFSLFLANLNLLLLSSSSLFLLPIFHFLVFLSPSPHLFLDFLSFFSYPIIRSFSLFTF